MIDLVMSTKPFDNSRYIYKKIEENLNNNKKSILIVPEQHTLETDVALLSSINYKSIMDAKVLSFSSFCKYVMDRIDTKKPNFLSKEGKLMLLTNILQDLDDSLDLFKSSYKNIDFINSIVDLIATIKDNKFDEDFFRKVYEESEDELVKIKFKELKLILDSYQKAIEGSFIDTEDRITFVSEHIREAKFLEGVDFFFDKFDNIEEIKLDLIDELYKNKNKISLALNLNPKAKGPDEPEIYDLAKRFYKDLSQRFSVNIVIPPLSTNDRMDLEHLSNNFEKYNYKIYAGEPKNIHLLENISSRSEVENIAILVNKAIKKRDDLRFNDISIYITNAGQYENEIIKTFDRYQIPIFLDKRRNMANNHIIKTFLALIRLAVDNFRQEDLYYVLNSRLIGVDDEEVYTLINFLNYRKIKGSMFLNDKYFVFDEQFYKVYLANDPKRFEKFEAKTSEYELVNKIRNRILDLVNKLVSIKNEEIESETIARPVSYTHLTLPTNREV